MTVDQPEQLVHPVAADQRRDRVTDVVQREAISLLAYFRRRVDEPEDAADLVAETLMVVWRRIEALPVDDTEARMWMFGIARHVHSDYHRGRRRRLALADKLRDHLLNTGRGLAPTVDGHHLDLANAMARLPPLDQEIIRLVHWDGLSLEEVSQHLSRPVGTIRSRYHRTRRRLREALDDDAHKLST